MKNLPAKENIAWSPFELQLAKFMGKLARGEKEDKELLSQVVMLLGRAVSTGNVCLPLPQLGMLLEQNFSLSINESVLSEKLMATEVVAIEGKKKPLVLDKQHNLYFYRYWRAENILAENIGKRQNKLLPVNNKRETRKLLQELFPDTKSPNRGQKTAVAMSLLKSLSVISGGPGTGKTYTVARILAAAISSSENKLRVGLAAPTGKAAVRLQESVIKAKNSLPVNLAKDIPEQATTIHRLLGWRPGAENFFYNQTNRLPLDLLVLDEASMIDVLLMSALLQALPDDSRLIFLGDQYQLSSVEAGNLFADLCRPSPVSSSMLTELSTVMVDFNPDEPLLQSDTVIRLNTSYRFGFASGIGNLAQAVNKGDLIGLAQVLATGYDDLSFYDYKKANSITMDLQNKIKDGYQKMLEAKDVTEAFAWLNKFRILSPLRRGQYGVDGLNNLSEQVLLTHGCIATKDEFYQGRPIIILSNNYGQNLFNGDTGLIWADEQGQLLAWFQGEDGRLFNVSLAMLPRHDTAYAITVHKAQGSEFAEVMLVLPAEDSLALSRELVYTGVTRAKNKLYFFASLPVLEKAVNRKTTRFSGLADMLNQKRHD